jgi:hypothetical protein
MNTRRLRELCDAAEAGSARPEDIAELVVLAREAANAHEELRLQVAYTLSQAPQGEPLQKAIKRLYNLAK